MNLSTNSSKKHLIVIIISLTIVILSTLIFYKTYYIPLQEYNSAMRAFDRGHYPIAQVQFEKLDNFKDSAEMVKECEYQTILYCIEQKDYEIALGRLDSLGPYKDSVELRKEVYYEAGLYNVEIYFFEYAEYLFTQIEDYKDAAYYLDFLKDFLLINGVWETTKTGEMEIHIGNSYCLWLLDGIVLEGYITYDSNNNLYQLPNGDKFIYRNGQLCFINDFGDIITRYKPRVQ